MKTSPNFPIFTCHRTLLDLRLAIFRRHPRKLGVEHWYLLRFPSQWICNQCIQYWGWGGRIACSGLSLLKRQPWKTYTAWQRCLMAQLGYIVSMRPIQRKVEVISRRPYKRMRVVLEPECRIAKSRRSLVSLICMSVWTSILWINLPTWNNHGLETHDTDYPHWLEHPNPKSLTLTNCIAKLDEKYCGEEADADSQGD